jgi:hypothetical protein
LAGEEVVGKELGRGVVGEKLLREEEVAEDVVGEELVILMCVCERER